MRTNLFFRLIIFSLLLASVGCSPKKTEWQSYNLNSLVTFEHPGDWNCNGDNESVKCDNGTFLSSASVFYNVSSVSSASGINKDTFASLLLPSSNQPGEIEEIEVDGAPAWRKCEYVAAAEMGICVVLAGKEKYFLITYSGMPWKENQAFFDGMLGMTRFAASADNQSEKPEWQTQNFLSLVTFEYPGSWQCVGDNASTTCSDSMATGSVSSSFGVYVVSQSYQVNLDTLASLGQFPGEHVDEIKVDGSPAFRKCKIDPDKDEGFCVVLAGKSDTFLFTYYRKPFAGNEAFLDVLLSNVHFVSTEEDQPTVPAIVETQPTATVMSQNQSTPTKSAENQPAETKLKEPPFPTDLGIVETKYFYNTTLEKEATLKSYGIPARIEGWGNNGTLVQAADLAELNWTDRTLSYKITYSANNLSSIAKFKIGSTRPILEETFPERWLVEYSDTDKFDIPGVITIYGYSTATQKYEIKINQYSVVENKLGKVQYRDLQGKTIEIDVWYFLVVPEAP